ncbi:MAG: bifunctional precorrin-2 dehydrogenase/sirohydrochlorin ferrochelatase [Syntrophaceae bacterium]|nr:bifunctional precorrin-2 dehydrogenase/sirohydrochlorin ferrochelatase [Syntrophaceae bacterium]
MKYYPVFLDIAGKPCVVVGGGEVACRKVHRLLECGAHVSVISRQLCPDLLELKTHGSVTHIDDQYQSEQIDHAFLVVGATDNSDVNGKIFRDARVRNILVNIVDEPEHCDFILPSIVERGDLSIAISTGGKSPALAKQLRQELEGIFGEEYDVYLKIMGKIREVVLARSRPSDDNRKIFEALVQSELLSLIRSKNWDAVQKLVSETVHEPIELRFP